MAKLTKYRILYTDIDSLEYRIDLKYEAWAGAITELQGSGNEINIEYQNEKFAPVNGSGISFSFLNNGSLSAEDFFIVGIYDIQIVVEALKVVSALSEIADSAMKANCVNKFDFAKGLSIVNIGLRLGNKGINIVQLMIDSETKDWLEVARYIVLKNADLGYDIDIKPYARAVENIIKSHNK